MDIVAGFADLGIKEAWQKCLLSSTKCWPDSWGGAGDGSIDGGVKLEWKEIGGMGY